MAEHFPQVDKNNIRLALDDGIDIEECVYNDSEEHYELQSILEQTCDEMHITPSDEFIRCTLSLADALTGKQNIVICGDVGCGKSTVIDILSKALEAGDSAGNVCEVLQHRIAPMSLTHEELYGSLLAATSSNDEQNKENISTSICEGVLPSILKDIRLNTFDVSKYIPENEAEDDVLSSSSMISSSSDHSFDSIDGKNENMNWIIFDGEPHKSWFDSLHDVFRMNQLSIGNGEIVKISPPNETVIMIECTKLKDVPPSVFSNMVLVSIPESTISISDIVQYYTSKLPKGIPVSSIDLISKQVGSALYVTLYVTSS